MGLNDSPRPDTPGRWPVGGWCRVAPVEWRQGTSISGRIQSGRGTMDEPIGS
jgi:hypothetical protein